MRGKLSGCRHARAGKSQMDVARAIVCALFCVALACAAGSACGKSLSEQHPGGDPDGRLLAALSSVIAATPLGAEIVYEHKRAVALGGLRRRGGNVGLEQRGFRSGIRFLRESTGGHRLRRRGAHPSGLDTRGARSTGRIRSHVDVDEAHSSRGRHRRAVALEQGAARWADVETRAAAPAGHSALRRSRPGTPSADADRP